MFTPRRITRPVAALATALLALAAASPSRATMTVTPPNLSRGFIITEFATGFATSGPPSGAGPFGIAFRDNGSVIVTDSIDQSLYWLPSHADNQIAPNIVLSYPTGSAPFALAQVYRGGHWHYYACINPDFVEFDPYTGNVLQTIIPNFHALGLAPFPPSAGGPRVGHIFAAGSVGIYDIDPVAMTSTLAVTASPIDGIAFSADGTRIYGAAGDLVTGYDVSSGTLIWTGPTHMGEGYDGIAVGIGNLAGYIYVNANSGDVWEFGEPGGPHNGVDNLLLTGGSRGDFIATDSNATTGGFPSLLLTQSDRILRLDPPGGGWMGPPTSSTQVVGSPTAAPILAAAGDDGRITVAPNPSAGPARVGFALTRAEDVRLRVLDLQGRELAVLVHGTVGPGSHQVEWDGKTLQGKAPAGVYFLKLEAGGQSSSRRFVLVR